MIRFMKSGSLLLVLESSVAASDLPDCPQDQSQRYHHCYGTHRWGSGEFNGDKYVGEFRDGVRSGQGMYYDSDGTVLERGIYEDGTFVD